MRILVEGYPYDYDLIKKVIPDTFIQATADKKSGIINYVGYYRSSKGLTSIILPKIFLNPKNSCLFGDTPYKDFLKNKITAKKLLESKGKSKKEISFISEYSLLIFRILKKYITRIGHYPPHIQKAYANIITSSFLEKDISKLDVIISLIKLHNENRYIYFRKKIVDRKLKNKIHWPKTIAKHLPFIINNQPYHLETKGSSKVYIREDILLTIFYSTLNRISKEYGFRIELDEGLPIVTGHKYKAVSKIAPRLLKQIKHFYYSDLHKEVIYLLRLYYGEGLQYYKRKDDSEYFLTDCFNIVFEDMIDYLISDQNDINKYKYQKDGKVLDHIYHERSLVSDSNTYFIGDSKYYKETTKISGESKYKQFTYAKNLLQMYIDTYEKKPGSKVLLREIVTEGYDIIPNFFILPNLNYDNLNEPNIILNEVARDYFGSVHFNNRLFDRDTFFALKIDINLLSVMKLYISKDSSQLKKIRAEIKSIVRKTICETLCNEYDLYKVMHDNIMDLIKVNFYLLNGKVFKPDIVNENEAYLALSKKSKHKTDNKKLMKHLIDLDIKSEKVQFR